MGRELGSDHRVTGLLFFTDELDAAPVFEERTRGTLRSDTWYARGSHAVIATLLSYPSMSRPSWLKRNYFLRYARSSTAVITLAQGLKAQAILYFHSSR